MLWWLISCKRFSSDKNSFFEHWIYILFWYIGQSVCFQKSGKTDLIREDVAFKSWKQKYHMRLKHWDEVLEMISDILVNK